MQRQNRHRNAFNLFYTVAFIITVPAQALAGKVGGPFLIVSLLIACAMLLLSAAFWRYGLKNDTGASA